MYDLDQLERAFMRTAVFRRFADVGCTEEERRPHVVGSLERVQRADGTNSSVWNNCRRRAQAASVIGSVPGTVGNGDVKSGVMVLEYTADVLDGTFCSSYQQRLVRNREAVIASRVIRGIAEHGKTVSWVRRK